MRELEQMLKALSDGTRLRILNLLLRGELCVCEIHFVLGLPQPTVSRHLGCLKNAGLVEDRREGPRVYYALAEPEEGIHRGLFAFLSRAFRGKDLLRKDLQKLAKAIERGACSTAEARRLPASIAARGRNSEVRLEAL